MIPIIFARSSSLQSWSTCKMAYYLIYGLGYQTPSGLAAVKGTICHKVLECLAICKKLIQDNEEGENFVCEDSEIGNIPFTKIELYTEEFVTKLLELAYNHYKTNNSHLEFNDKTDYKFCQNMLDYAFNHNNGQFDPREQNIFQPEIGFVIEIDQPWARFEHEGEMVNLCIKGTIDLIIRESENTLMVCDYKSGATRKDFATGKVKNELDFYQDIQLLLYYFAVCHLYPEVKYVIVTILYLQAGGPFTVCFDKSNHDVFLLKLKKIFEEIRSCNNPEPINPWRSDFRCTRLCHFYKTNWPGTETKMCYHAENYIKTYGITKASEDLKKPGFTVGHYHSPGT